MITMYRSSVGKYFGYILINFRKRSQLVEKVQNLPDGSSLYQFKWLIRTSVLCIKNTNETVSREDLSAMDVFQI